MGFCFGLFVCFVLFCFDIADSGIEQQQILDVNVPGGDLVLPITWSRASLKVVSGC